MQINKISPTDRTALVAVLIVQPIVAIWYLQPKLHYTTRTCFNSTELNCSYLLATTVCAIGNRLYFST